MKTKTQIGTGPVMVGDIKLGGINFSEHKNGYYFIPCVAGRHGSRRAWPTAEACLPAWVKRIIKKHKPTS